MHQSLRSEADINANLVAVPVFDQLVLAHSPEVVRVRFKRNLHNAIVMCEQRSMAVAEIKSPDLDILVSRTRYNEL